jgi:hypothetical protein
LEIDGLMGHFPCNGDDLLRGELAVVCRRNSVSSRRPIKEVAQPRIVFTEPIALDGDARKLLKKALEVLHQYIFDLAYWRTRGWKFATRTARDG